MKKNSNLVYSNPAPTASAKQNTASIDGASIESIIDGVIIKKLKQFKDNRGWLTEIYRDDQDIIQPVMGYVSHTDYSIIRGPHEHKLQNDFFIFIGYGDFMLYLWDNRIDSPTHGNKMEFIVGESYHSSVIVPPGVVHGYKSISANGSFSINLPDVLYAGKNKKESVDEIRHETDPNSKFKIK